MVRIMKARSKFLDKGSIWFETHHVNADSMKMIIYQYDAEDFYELLINDASAQDK